ncbi:uncharacterized protein LOC132902028 [Amyelois transitella]|uniref:uncharacterized protein LOC132902028 n=1 Tax=Amyelois transitella TaxID=680683 RepID=UPI00298F8100|nr:uncharacterized protein LOC132902028 [Amyelois transitella]
MDEQGLVETLNAGSRKKKRKDRSEYRKTTYTDKDPLCINYRCPCNHKSLKTFKCKRLTLQDIIENRKLFFKRRGKVDQDIYLSRLLAPYEPLNRGKSNPRATTKNRKVSCTYHLYINKKLTTVCKQVFQKTFAIGEKRLRNLNVRLSQGETPTEKRGGDRKAAKSREKKEKLREFLKKLPAQESHYNRQKSKRIYLSSELNAARLLRIYNLSVPENLRVSRTMFHNIFYNEFNIGFKSPATDACSVCILWTNKIKNETNSQRKQTLMIEKRVHKLRSNVFYELLRKPVANSIRLCFDLQKVLPLPRTPIQDAFYSRQISFYNFCITKKTKTNLTFLYGMRHRLLVDL